MSEQVRAAETKLATWAGWYLRAHASGDQSAQRQAAKDVCLGLRWLLSGLLESTASWDSRQRWIDCLIGAQFAVDRPDRIKVRGRMVWGLVTDAGGPQWSEPFEAELTLDPASVALRSYTLRFGDQRDLSTKEVKTGMYGTLADSRGQVVFRPFPPGRDKERPQLQAATGPEPASEELVYQFRKDDSRESDS